MAESDLLKELVSQGTAIGKLQGQAEGVLSAIEGMSEKQDKILDVVASIKTEQEATKGRFKGTNKRIGDLEDDIEENIKPVVENYKSNRLLAIGALFGAGTMGGGVGAFFASLWQKFGGP